MNNSTKTNKGMTILELLITIAIIAILSAVTINYFKGQIVEVSLNSTAKTFISDINTARQRAIAGDRGMDWGIRAISTTNNSGTWEMFATSSLDLEVEPFVSETNILPSGLSWNDPSVGSKEILFKAILGSAPSTKFVLGFGTKKIEINISENGEVKATRL